MVEFLDENAAKKAAIHEARNSEKPSVSAEEAISIFEANLARVRNSLRDSENATG